MKCLGLALVIATAGVATCSHASPNTIRVRLLKGITSTEVAGLGLNIAATPSTVQAVSLPQVRQATVRLLQNKNRFPVWTIGFKDERTPRRFMSSRLYVEGDLVRLGLNPAPHALEFVALANGRMDVIATLDIEKYLTGVLPSEMPAQWPLEALKAQAVASRSYALAVARDRRELNYDVESSVLDQVFDMKNKVGATNYIQNKVAEVVRQTAGQILVDERGRPVKAHYHADCGGNTELAKNVWGENVKETGTTADAMCPLSPYANWIVKIPREELSRTLLSHFELSAPSMISGVAPVGRTISGRVAKVDLLFNNGQRRRIPAAEFREILGYSRIRSTNFRLIWNTGDLVIEGKGHGHGVGLCQYGTRQLATRGLSYEEILKNYYPEVRLQRPGLNQLRRLTL